MNHGEGGIRRSPRILPGSAGPPFPLNSADNGLSVDTVSRRIVLGQRVGQVGDPAKLLNDREIPLNGKIITFKGNNIQLQAEDVGGSVLIRTAPTNYFFNCSPPGNLYQFGDMFGLSNGNKMSIQTGFGQDQVLFANTARNTRMGINSGGLGNRPDFTLDVLGTIGVSDNAVPNNGFPTNALLTSKSMFVANNTTNANNLVVASYGATNPNAMVFYRTRGVTPNTQTPLISGDGIGSQVWFGVDSANTVIRSARLLITAGTIGAGIVGTNMVWQTCNSAGAFSSRMRLSENGDFSVGTTTPNASALVQIDSVLKGFAQPRMTTVQKNAIAAPLVGLSLFDTTLNQPSVFDGVWKSVPIGNDGAAAPATAVIGVPANVYGVANTKILGDPNGWAALTINGTIYKVPLYT